MSVNGSSRWWRRGRPLCLAALAVFLLSTSVGAQERNDSLSARIDSLQARIDSLEAAMRELDGGGAEVQQDPVEALRAAAEEAARAADEDEDAQEPEFVGRQRSLQALNPEISVNADFLAFTETGNPDVDNFLPREVEFAFQAPLDPFSRAAIFLGYHTPGGELIPFAAALDDVEPDDGEAHEDPAATDAHDEHGGIELEEAYVEWVSLPGGVALKIGQFYQQLGAMNRWHRHALPFQSRPLPHLVFVGAEPLSQAGASARILLPVGRNAAYEATLELTRSSNPALFGDSRQPSFLGHLNGFWQLTESWDLDLGATALGGRFRLESDEHAGDGTVEELSVLEFDQRLYSLEGSVTWRPAARSLYRGLNVRGGAVVRDPRGADDLETNWGAWIWSEWRLGRRWLAGARYEWVQDPGASGESAWLLAPTLTWWQSEWVRVRFEWDHLDDPAGAVNALLLQFTFAMGPHKHETY